jgi:hypothetical protein
MEQPPRPNVDSMTVEQAIGEGWTVVCYSFEPAFALVERLRPDGLRERALAAR